MFMQVYAARRYFCSVYATSRDRGDACWVRSIGIYWLGGILLSPSRKHVGILTMVTILSPCAPLDWRPHVRAAVCMGCGRSSGALALFGLAAPCECRRLCGLSAGRY